MKLILPAILLAACCLSPRLHAQQAAPDDFNPEKGASTPGESSSGKIKYALILPEEKTAEEVKISERNPFGKTAEETSALSGLGKGTTEENSIREHMEKLKIVGVSPGPKGMRVMLGDMVLESGEIVPPVVADQTLGLRVGHITDHSIELIWIEKKPTGMPPRMLTLPLDMHHYVRYALQGQTSEKAAAAQKGSAKTSALALGTQTTPAQSVEPAAKLGAIASEPKTEKGPAEKVSAEKGPVVADAPVIKNQADAHPASSTPDLEPEGWKRAVGFLNDLVKLEEVKK